jgi:hypothetical protein
LQTGQTTENLVLNNQGNKASTIFLVNDASLGTASRRALTIHPDSRINAHDSRIMGVKNAINATDAVNYKQADSLCRSKVSFLNLSASIGSTVLDAEGKSAKTFRVAIDTNGTYSFSIANPISGATYKIKFYGSATSANVNFVNFSDAAQNTIMYSSLNLSGNSLQNLSVTYDAQTERYYLD